MKEAEQERQWKALQALRAREQQMGMPPIHHMNGEFNILFPTNFYYAFISFRSKCSASNFDDA